MQAWFNHCNLTYLNGLEVGELPPFMDNSVYIYGASNYRLLYASNRFESNDFFSRIAQL